MKPILDKIKENRKELREHGSALIFAVLAVAILSMLAATTSLMMASEVRSADAGIMAQKALSAAESGIQDILYQRSKMADQSCFPYYYLDPDGTITTDSARETLIEEWTGAKPKKSSASGADKACDLKPIIAGDEESVAEYLPCWPYNERLYEGTLHWGPNFSCHDGTMAPDCVEVNPSCDDNNPSSTSCYSPLFWWPAKDDGGIGWKDVDPVKEGGGSYPVPLQDPLPKPYANNSSGARYTTGFFTLCNDDFEGITAAYGEGYEKACNDARSGGKCDQFVTRLQIVSVGEVQNGDKVVRRAVKVDLEPPALYAGVLDKYVDVTGMWHLNINGPVHINGWRGVVGGVNKWNAFLYALVGGFGTFLDPPDLVSVSYPEDPLNPDWQPRLFGIGFAHDITWIHVPVKIDIPKINWDKWEDRMDALYAQAATEYSDSTVYPLKRCYFKANVRDTSGECGDASAQYTVEGGQTDEARDVNFPQFVGDGMLGYNRYNTGTNKIHNVWANSTNAQVWSTGNKHIFDLYDEWNEYSGSYVEGEEPPAVHGQGSTSITTGPRDRSLKHKKGFVIDPNMDVFGKIMCVFTNGLSIESFKICIGANGDPRYGYQNRAEFVFMGKHEYRDFVFIDGVMGIGQRSPYHSCGDLDDQGSNCIKQRFACFGIDLSFVGLGCLGLADFDIVVGVPHFHMGEARITGEMLVNGDLFMADYVHVDGGSIYTDGTIIKDESSGYDISLDISILICDIFTKVLSVGVIEILGFLNINVCSIIMGILNPLIVTVLPWWPTIYLTNNDLIHNDTYLDIDGNGPFSVINPGTIYTRGDFRLQKPAIDALSFLVTAAIGMLTKSIKMNPALRGVRIYNNGALIAGGRSIGTETKPRYLQGNIFFDQHDFADLLTCEPDDPSNLSKCDKQSTGFVLARGGLSVYSDIISKYKNWAIASCSATSFSLGVSGGLDEDCAARGIFYSGGQAAYSDDTKSMFGRRTVEIYKTNVTDYETHTRSACPPIYDGGVLGIGCWGSAIGDLLSGRANEMNVRGHVFAGAMGAMVGTHLRLNQDSSVRHGAVTRQYFEQMGGAPINWQEIEPPANLPSIAQ